MRLAALEATLKLYRDPDRLAERLPALRFFSRSRADIRLQAEALAPVLAKALGPLWRVTAEDCASQIGSGALPQDLLPSAALAATPFAKAGRGRALEGLAERMRGLTIPVIGRISDDRLLLDLRCLEDAAALAGVLAELGDLA